MFTVLAAIAGCLIGVLVTRLMARPDVVAPTKDFICPYCTIEITGAKSLDLINHIPCINKADADLEQMRKNAKKEKEDEYYIDVYQDKRRNSSEDLDYFDFVGGAWLCWRYEVYRNGEKIKAGYSATKAVTEKSANKVVEIDKYQRRNRAKT